MNEHKVISTIKVFAEVQHGEKCLFFKNDSCLSDCLSVFTQKLIDKGKLKVKLQLKGEEAND